MIIEQTEDFQIWEAGLRDRRLRSIIAARIYRVAEGLLGDVAPIGEGISELRIHYGAGYRIYFKKQGDFLILLLCGGDKNNQAKDIMKAKILAREWSI